MGENRLIGAKNGLLWHIPDDLKRFKALTQRHPCIMGRKTFDSILAILGKPLPNRTSIIVTREKEWQHEGVLAVHSLEDALQKAKALDEEVFVIGGTQIYEQALPFVERLYLTLINDKKEGDAFFPPYEHLFTKKLSEENREYNGLKYTWVTLER